MNTILGVEGERIFKYEVPVRGSVLMPKKARIIHLDLQHGVPMMWALVTPGELEDWRNFIILPTGGEILYTGIVHIGTFLVDNGALVWHVFEKID